MPGKEIEDGGQRTTQNLRDRGMNHYAYGKPLAGLMPRIREVLTDKQMEELGIAYVACLHDPIKNSDGYPDVLSTLRYGHGRHLGAYYVHPTYRWRDGGSFAFPVSTGAQT
jgi:hypothetical protein